MPWWSEDDWKRMKRGDGCAMCADAHLETNPFSDLLAETPSSFVRLHRNQTHAGYCVVIARHHAPELHDLSPEERCGFWNDVAIIGQAISLALQPRKLANLSMGFRVPHYHCHVYPQYDSDDPFRLIDVTQGEVTLDPAEWTQRAELLRGLFRELSTTLPD